MGLTDGRDPPVSPAQPLFEGAVISHRPINKIDRVCEFCSAAFLAWPHEVKAGQGRYCSRPCLAEGRRGKKLNRVILPVRTECVCEFCQKPFLAKPSEVRRGGSKYCSRPCYAKGKHIPLGRQFLNYASEPDENGCIIWTGTTTETGYGHMGSAVVGRINIAAHRFAFELAYGPIPEGMHVLHMCDNPPCVNPLHLSMGTAADNAADKVAKGRHIRGEQSYFSKITEEQVRAMRESHKNGIGIRKLAKQYGMCIANISHIVNRLTWKHVD